MANGSIGKRPGSQPSAPVHPTVSAPKQTVDHSVEEAVDVQVGENANKKQSALANTNVNQSPSIRPPQRSRREQPLAHYLGGLPRELYHHVILPNAPISDLAAYAKVDKASRLTATKIAGSILIAEIERYAQYANIEMFAKDAIDGASNDVVRHPNHKGEMIVTWSRYGDDEAVREAERILSKALPNDAHQRIWLKWASEQPETVDTGTAIERLTLARKEGSESLSLDHLGLTSLPPLLTALPALRHLNFDGNRIQECPLEFKDSKIASLSMRDNHLQEIPEFIWKMPNLKSLYASDNDLQRIDIPQNNAASKLETVALRNNHLQELPSQFATFGNMQHLDLSNNRFQTVPVSSLGRHWTPKEGSSVACVFVLLQHNPLRPLDDATLRAVWELSPAIRVGLTAIDLD